MRAARTGAVSRTFPVNHFLLNNSFLNNPAAARNPTSIEASSADEQLRTNVCIATPAIPQLPLQGHAAAFLISRYPAVSHTFILREVAGLRSLGLRVETASINDPDQKFEVLAEEEQQEALRTFYVKRAGFRTALVSHFAVAVLRPGGYWHGLRLAFRLSGGNIRGFLFALCYFTEALMVGRWMRRLGLCHLHVHFATAASTVGLLAARTFGFGYSLTVHGPDEFYDVSLYRLREKFSAAGFICCIGQYAKSQVLRLLPPTEWRKVHVARLGVDADRFCPAPRAAEHGEFRVICVGRLVETKGQAVLIAAVKRLAGEGFDVHLRLIGDGPGRSALEALAVEAGLRDRIVFDGSVNPDLIRERLSGADVFVLPTFAEGIPVALMEAMAMEIPCITTFVNGIPELIESGINGLLVPPADSESLADAIRSLISDNELRLRIARAGRRTVLERYSLQSNVRRLAEIWQQCHERDAEEAR